MTSRWFKVVSDRFDWMPKPGIMRVWHRDEIGYAPLACVQMGVRCGLIEMIERPEGYKVDKRGMVHAG